MLAVGGGMNAIEMAISTAPRGGDDLPASSALPSCFFFLSSFAHSHTHAPSNLEMQHVRFDKVKRFLLLSLLLFVATGSRRLLLVQFCSQSM